jgi:CMP-2-keto-3-deoxyoctulosonic acid synthetase
MISLVFDEDSSSDSGKCYVIQPMQGLLTEASPKLCAAVTMGGFCKVFLEFADLQHCTDDFTESFIEYTEEEHQAVINLAKDCPEKAVQKVLELNPTCLMSDAQILDEMVEIRMKHHFLSYLGF